MKQKKLLVSILVFLFSSTVAFGQFAIGISTGFLGAAFQSNSLVSSETDENGDETETISHFSLGGGVPINIAVNIPLTDMVFLDIGFSYLFGSRQTVMSSVNQEFMITEMSEAFTRQLRGTIGFCIHSESGLYGKFGAVLPLAGKTVVESTNSYSFGTVNSTMESKGMFSMGAYASTGYAFEIGNDLSLFGELHAVALNIKSNTSEVVSFSTSTGGTIADLEGYQIHTTFVDMIDENSNIQGNADFDADQPKDELRSTASFGGFGFVLGVALSF
jgi:hypothetical protein